MSASLSCNPPSPSYFTERLLGFSLYPWQRDVLDWYALPRQRVLGALATPNGAGKSSCIVGGLAFWWLNAHPEGRVVITTKDRRGGLWNSGAWAELGEKTTRAAAPSRLPAFPHPISPLDMAKLWLHRDHESLRRPDRRLYHES